MPVWFSFALIAMGLLAIYVEIFVPAAGLIGLAGGGMIVAAVVIGYAEHGGTTGSVVLITALVVTPVAIVVGLRLFPRTGVGRRLILGGSNETDAESDLAVPETPAGIESGARGTALTILRPSGTARIGDRKLSVVTRGEYIDRGSAIEVVRVDGNRVVVREA